jgi:Methyltransferase domain
MDHVIMKRRMARAQNISHLFAADRRQVFDQIYTQGVWLESADQVARSGSGSELAATTQVRDFLPALLAHIGARSLLDVGCGDFSWMQHVDLVADYIGIDVVPSVISANENTFGSMTRTFHCVDAVDDPLPLADAVLCREVLFHLSFADIERLVNNVALSGARYLIATSDTRTAFNANIRTGDYRLLNLRRRPFRFPRPQVWMPDDSRVGGRGLGVWSLEEIPLRYATRAVLRAQADRLPLGSWRTSPRSSPSVFGADRVP